jgi:uncharacterized zinc-type alcohol dehydrogenase-like protein
MKYVAWVAKGDRGPMAMETFDPGPLGPDEVELAVEHCGLCHSDLSVLKNEWGISRYPAVLGHEVTGVVTSTGASVRSLRVGQTVGVGWLSGSCMHCRQCLSGEHNMCRQAQPTIVGHRGGFASHLRAHWAWVFPLPDQLSSADAGPLLCGGVTVLAPLLMHAKPTDRVGIIGIGGLGHLALQFASAYGCEVTAFTSNVDKFDEARQFGADRVVSSTSSAILDELAGAFDLLINTSSVEQDWNRLLGTLAPNGRLHVVGATTEPVSIAPLALIAQQRGVSGSLVGAPATIAATLEFASRHGITPRTEHFPMSQINEALARLEAGKARYRIVLDADFCG